jgi:hypothetical protein
MLLVLLESCLGRSDWNRHRGQPNGKAVTIAVWIDSNYKTAGTLFFAFLIKVVLAIGTVLKAGTFVAFCAVKGNPAFSRRTRKVGFSIVSGLQEKQFLRVIFYRSPYWSLLH